MHIMITVLLAICTFPMPNLREVTARINSTAATQQITNAMKMVAAARLGTAQQKVLQILPYVEQLTKLLTQLSARTAPQLVQRYFAPRRLAKNLLLVVMSADRGLCGAFNNKILHKSLQYLRTSAYASDPTRVTILPVGSKALAYFQKSEYRLIVDHVHLSQHLALSRVRPVVDRLLEEFLQQTYDQVVLIYHTFKNAATHIPSQAQFLPIARPTIASVAHGSLPDWIDEPSPAALLESLIPEVLQTQFYKALLSANASEHGARMTAMSHATENADALLKELRLTYHRTRQAAITQEISEIVSGSH